MHNYQTHHQSCTNKNRHTQVVNITKAGLFLGKVYTSNCKRNHLAQVTRLEHQHINACVFLFLNIYL